MLKGPTSDSRGNEESMILLLTGLASAEVDAWGTVMLNEYDAPIVWEAMPVSYFINASNDAGLEEAALVYPVVSAALAWDWAPNSGAKLAYQGADDTAVAAHDDINVVYFTADWPADSSLLALTTVWSESSGRAVGFDIRINTRDHEWTLDPVAEPDKNDLQNTLTHEFGHALGFGHIEDDSEATMYPSAPIGETKKRDLSEADSALVATIYPDGEVPLAEDSGAEAYDPVLAALCGTRPGNPLALPTLLALAALGTFRARRSEAA
jgi:hypothetical protein